MISCSLEDHGKPRRRTVAVGPRGEAPGQPGRGTPKPGRMCPEPGVNGAPLEATLETAGVTASVVAAASMGGMVCACCCSCSEDGYTSMAGDALCWRTACCTSSSVKRETKASFEGLPPCEPVITTRSSWIFRGARKLITSSC